jgi:DNA-binding NtrC family response regulator
MSEKPRLLLIDDGERYAQVVQSQMPEYQLVRVSEAYLRAQDGPEALSYLDTHHDDVDLILLDMRFDVPQERLLPLPEANTVRKVRRYQGVAILRILRQQYANIPVVVLTALQDLSVAEIAQELESLSLTYMLQGDDLDALRIRIHEALIDCARLPEEDGVLWGRDATLRDLRRRMAVLARGRLPIVIEGETGTGKSYLAERYIHKRSARTGPFITVDLATIPRELISAHLFGAVKGAYTGAITDRKGVFETAHKGTVFIDEIQNIPLEIQKQLLLVLQDQVIRPLGSNREISVDVKIIVASNVSLSEAVRDGRFRSDLYMRLSPATRVMLPPLRERPDDIPFLARRLTERAGSENDISAFRFQLNKALGLPEDAPVQLLLPDDPRSDTNSIQLMLAGPSWRRLLRHRWSGNVRELSMVLHNLVTFSIVRAIDALESGLSIKSRRLQVDPGLVNQLLAGGLDTTPSEGNSVQDDPDLFNIRLSPADSLNAVSKAVEYQYLSQLFDQVNGDLDIMADRLLGDPERARAIRLRLNQVGLRLRELRRR